MKNHGETELEKLLRKHSQRDPHMDVIKDMRQMRGRVVKHLVKKQTDINDNKLFSPKNSNSLNSLKDVRRGS